MLDVRVDLVSACKCGHATNLTTVPGLLGFERVIVHDFDPKLGQVNIPAFPWSSKACGYKCFITFKSFLLKRH